MDTVLIVDDEVETCSLLGKALRKKGYNTEKAYNGKDALEVLNEKKVDVVLLDMRMPFMGGKEALAKIREKHPYVEVLMVTAFGDIDGAVESLKQGAFGFIQKPVQVESLFMEIEQAVEHGRMARELGDYRQNLEKKVEERAEQVRLLLRQMQKNFANFLKMFVEVQALYDPRLAGHSQRVALMVEKTGRKLGLEEKALHDLQLAALFHDLGVIGLSDKIRTTPLGELEEAERELVKQQTLMTQETLAAIQNLQRAGELIRSHLERVDGKGFPDGLSGNAIPLESRILSVANAYDEMRYSRRFAKEGEFKDLTDEEIAAAHLNEFAGKKFDKAVVEKYLEAAKEMDITRKNIAPVELDGLREGMVLAEDVRNGRQLILAKGSRLTPMQIEFIKNKVGKTGATRKIYVLTGDVI